ncbi:hypothetical protein SAMN05216349_11731 [Oribacterium sp. KHPX15]|uniref:glycosyltransferase family 4 protein n=1 Tax=Oribacterium sp. KHPX15 TaxID=1855342 RepID=UPI00089CD812|nr:glycosyltransferase family 4 protein [Oribacterium sp. KHPX15]SEA56845.1 hypothetical protein SAMN05216349_11731 [Oribacterium sp. KHPX15]
MKVIFVASDNNRASGAFICMVNLVQELRNRNLDARVILPKDGDGTELLNKAEIPYRIIRSYSWDTPIDSGMYYLSKIPVKKFLNHFAIAEIKKYFLAEKPDIIHINTTYSYVAAVAAYSLGIPVVWHIREFFEEDQNNRMWNRDWGYSLMGRADAIITISQAIYDKYKKILPEEKIRIVHDGVREDRFYDPEKTIFDDVVVDRFFTPQKTVSDDVKLTISGAPKAKMVCVGGLYPGKGQSTLLEAIDAYVQKNDRNLILKLVGRGPEEKKLKEWVKEKNLEDIISFEGYSNEPEKYYKEADISFMTSRSEAFGLVTVEAMLSGALVIGANSAGTREIVEEGRTGLLYTPEDSQSLENAIEYALKNKDKSRAMAAAGRKAAMDRFVLRVNADKVLDVYKDILGLKENIQS